VVKALFCTFCAFLRLIPPWFFHKPYECATVAYSGWLRCDLLAADDREKSVSRNNSGSRAADSGRRWRACFVQRFPRRRKLKAKS